MTDLRIESDSMGPMEVPAEALYGASTQRARLNFPISGQTFPSPILRALGQIKLAAATANRDLGRLEPAQAELILQAARELAEGQLDGHFPLDVYQTGSGTSTHMNANEVIANRCSQLAGQPLGSKHPIHPNDHVNLGQSSNDVFPSAIHLAVGSQLSGLLIPALEALQATMEAKAEEFWPHLKTGRTHLMDATPVRLGQEFSGYAQQVLYSVQRARRALEAILELPLGGTAVGTGINTHPHFARLAIASLREQTAIAWREAANHFEAQAARDGLVECSGQLKTIAVSLFKIANDLRWMASGPRCGLGEITLPAIQPGSSIMPGKTNPVLCESLLQVCTRVIGNDSTLTWAAAQGNFELNVMMPIIAHTVLESLLLLSNAIDLFNRKCVAGIIANPERCRTLVEESLAMATALAPILGYERAAQIAQESVRTGLPVRQICQQWEVLPPAELALALDPLKMTQPTQEN